MLPDTREQLDQITDRLIQIVGDPTSPLKHTEIDAMARNALGALIEIDQEDDEFILEVCKEIRAKLDEFATRETWPPDSGSRIKQSLASGEYKK